MMSSESGPARAFVVRVTGSEIDVGSSVAEGCSFGFSKCLGVVRGMGLI